MTKVCSILGNGPSRKALGDYPRPIFACNAYYRDGDPDYLVAIDPGMVEEILQSSFPSHKFLVTPFNDQFEPFEWNPNRPRENAGMVAMKKAIGMGYGELNCYGFDFLLDNRDLNMGNVYIGSVNYGPETQTSYQDAARRVDYFDWFVRQNPNVQFNMIYPQNCSEMEFRGNLIQNIKIIYTD